VGLISNFAAGLGWFQSKEAVAEPFAVQAIPSVYSIFLSPNEITPHTAWQLYENVATAAKVIDQIADQVADLDPLFTIKGQEIDDNGALLEFMDAPGFNRDRRRLIKELTVQLLATGTCYLGIYGNVKYTPNALDVLKSFTISPVAGLDMMPVSYIYAEGSNSNHFSRTGNIDFRWFDRSGMAEIVPIMDMEGRRRGIGLSRMNAIKKDVELRLQGTEHNLNMMRNGARPSGALVFKERLNEAQAAAVQADIKGTMVGAGNAGKVMLFSGGEAEFLQMSQTAKDMDWANLVKVVEQAIIARYNIPITLYETSAQTDNNYETAWMQFYDNAVLPTFKIVWGGIARSLSQRIGVKLEVKHNTLTNNTLARQASARARELRGAGLVTTNEARALVGYEDVVGGDVLLASAGEVPIGEDYFTDNEDAIGRPLRKPQEPRRIEKDKEKDSDRKAVMIQ
jgi:HK97 family phage portal protein